MYASFSPNFSDAYLTVLENCVHHLRDWLNCNKLSLNFTKTEVLLVAPPKLNVNSVRQVNLCDVSIPYTRISVAKCLGVLLDNH